MKIFICGGVDANVKKEYKQGIKQLANGLLKLGHEIILVGAKTGAIGEVYNTYLEKGGKINLMVPECYASDAENMTGNAIINVPNLYILQQVGFKNSDATIVLPGGNGTLAEMYMCADNNKAGFDIDPIYVFNINGYYNLCKQMHKFMVEAGTMKPSQANYLKFCDSYTEILNCLKSTTK